MLEIVTWFLLECQLIVGKEIDGGNKFKVLLPYKKNRAMSLSFICNCRFGLSELRFWAYTVLNQLPLLGFSHLRS